MKIFLRKHNKGIYYVGVSILALGATESLSHALRLGGDGTAISNSVFSVLSYVGIWMLINHTRDILNKRLFVCAVALGFLFSSMLVIGTKMYLYDMGRWDSVYTYISILELTPLLGCVIAHIFYYFESIMQKISQCRSEKTIRLLITDKPKIFLRMWMGILICWIPGLLATYPGVYAYDSIFQVDWFMNGQMNSHHPILHTYFVGYCMKFGKTFMGSYENGILIYSLIQMIFLSGVFAYISTKISKIVPALIQIVVVFLFAFLPYHSLFSFSVTKDVIFAGLFSVLVWNTYEITINPDAFFKDRKKQIFYMLLSFLMFAFRNNGVYAFICMIPVMILIFRKYWKNVVFMCMGILLLWKAYTGPVYDLLNIEPGRSAEAFSVPLQQLSRAMRDNRNELETADIKLIETYIPDYKEYGARSSDYVKNTFNQEYYGEHKMELVKLWLRVGIKCPLTYLDAFISTNLGFWYPDMVYPDPGTGHPYIEYYNSGQIEDLQGENWILIERTSYIPILSKVYDVFAYSTIFKGVPVISMFFSVGIPFWCICIAITFCIYKKKYQMLVPLSLIIGLWITLMLSPVVLFRYVYPIVVSLPIVLCMCCDKPEEKKEEEIIIHEKNSNISTVL